jgi:hypothetical protein
MSKPRFASGQPKHRLAEAAKRRLSALVSTIKEDEFLEIKRRHRTRTVPVLGQKFTGESRKEFAKKMSSFLGDEIRLAKPSSRLI